MFRRKALKTIVVSLAAPVASALGQGHFPSKPLRIVVPWTPGGAADLTARMLAGGLASRLGQPVIVENKAGAGGRIGTEEVARALPDGYTLLLGGPSTNSIPYGLGTSLPYDPVDDFEPVAFVSRLPLAIVTNAQQGIDSFTTLIEHAKARPDLLTYGSAGSGTGTHLAMAAVLGATGVSLKHVPYRGQAPALNDLLGGHINLLLDQMASKPHVDGGRLRVLATTGEKRWFIFPNAPTLGELGLSDLSIYSWQSLMVPRRTPREVIELLNVATNGVLNTLASKEFFQNNGMEAGGGSVESLRSFVRADAKRWQTVVKRYGIRVTE